VACMHNGVLFSYKEKQNYVFSMKTDGTRHHHVNWIKPDSERQIPHFLSHAESTFDWEEERDHQEGDKRGKWGGEYDQITLYTCMKCHNATH
jgi:hypothetical protein